MRRLIVVAAMLAAGCGEGGVPDYRAQQLATDPAALDSVLNPIAESYVKLVLAVGEHDPGYVDAYYGPAAWRDAVRGTRPPLDGLAATADSLLALLAPVPADSLAELARLRHRFLVRQLEAVRAYVGILAGDTLRFDEESRALYDAVAPALPEDGFRELQDSLSALLPGDGPLAERVASYRQGFVIPIEKLDTVFRAAIAEARRRTAQHVALPVGEDFRLEYVSGRPWSGYNWFQGNARSLIQINTELPVPIDRAVDLAAHEGYPGHHVYNALLESTLVRGRGWPEYAVYPLFSPQSLIAEGTANYGIEMVFPGEQRLAFERDVLFPLAGLDSARAAEYRRVQGLVERLGSAVNEAARRYLDGRVDADSALAWLTGYALHEPERARQQLRFIETYRSYVITYSHGRDLVRRHVEALAGPGADEARRWAVFAELLSSPRLASGLEAR